MTPNPLVIQHLRDALTRETHALRQSLLETGACLAPVLLLTTLMHQLLFPSPDLFKNPGQETLHVTLVALLLARLQSIQRLNCLRHQLLVYRPDACPTTPDARILTLDSGISIPYNEDLSGRLNSDICPTISIPSPRPTVSLSCPGLDSPQLSPFLCPTAHPHAHTRPSSATFRTQSHPHHPHTPNTPSEALQSPDCRSPPDPAESCHFGTPLPHPLNFFNGFLAQRGWDSYPF